MEKVRRRGVPYSRIQLGGVGNRNRERKDKVDERERVDKR